MAAQPAWPDLLLIAALLTTALGTGDRGFELLFKTQPDTVSQRPVKFERPLPSWIKGTLTRNGFGRFENGPRKFHHAFDGFAKLSSWAFVHPNLTFFSTDFVGTSFYRESVKSNNIAPYLMFDKPIPEFNVLEKFNALFKGIDNTNVHIHRLGDAVNGTGTYVALGDFWQCYAFDPLTTATTGYVDADVPGGSPFGKLLPLPSTAHPLRESDSDALISFVSLMNPMPLSHSFIRLIRIQGAYQRQRIVDIPVAEVPYMHSFGMSRHYAAIMAAPLYVNIATMLATSNPSQSLDWKPKQGMTVYVVHLRTGRTLALKTDAVMPMHFVNAYEDGNMLFIDYVTYPDIQFIMSFTMDNLLDPVLRNGISPDATLKRYAINLQDRTIEWTDMSLTPGREFVNRLDFPQINPNYAYRDYCYIYGTVVKADAMHMSNTKLVKKDVCSSGNDIFWYRQNHYPTEPIFIPSPYQRSEDDGVLISVVLDGEKGVTYLGVYNARNMELINTCYLDIHIPFTLHGQFFPTETRRGK